LPDAAEIKARPPDIVGIVAEVDGVERGELGPLEAVNQAVAGIGHEDRVRRGVVDDALRLFEPADPAQDFAGSKIHDPQAVVAELGHVQPLPAEIDREVVDPTAHVTKGDFPLEDERLRRARDGGQRRARERREREGCREEFTAAGQSIQFDPSSFAWVLQVFAVDVAEDRRPPSPAFPLLS
jgi:hypothetical protein